MGAFLRSGCVFILDFFQDIPDRLVEISSDVRMRKSAYSGQF